MSAKIIQLFPRAAPRRTLSRLLSRHQPIEAHCAICDGHWAIDAHERARLAGALELSGS